MFNLSFSIVYNRIVFTTPSSFPEAPFKPTWHGFSIRPLLLFLPIQSANPSAQAASTLPLTYFTCVGNLFSSPADRGFVANFSKYRLDRPTKLVTTRFPTSSSADLKLLWTGTCTV